MALHDHRSGKGGHLAPLSPVHYWFLLWQQRKSDFSAYGVQHLRSLIFRRFPNAINTHQAFQKQVSTQQSLWTTSTRSRLPNFPDNGTRESTNPESCVQVRAANLVHTIRSNQKFTKMILYGVWGEGWGGGGRGYLFWKGKFPRKTKKGYKIPLAPAKTISPFEQTNRRHGSRMMRL